MSVAGFTKGTGSGRDGLFIRVREVKWGNVQSLFGGPLGWD